MKSVLLARPRFLLALGLLTTAITACRSTAPAPAAASTATAAATVQPAASEPVAAEFGPQPPDGKWLKNEAGVEYFLERLPRQAGMGYKKIDAESAVRLGGGDDLYMSPWGVPVRVASMDDESVYIKVFRLVRVAKPEPPPKDSPEVVAARYQSEAVAVHDLQFLPFDKGLPRSGQWRQQAAVADMNGDGHVDIVHAPARKGRGLPLVFLGDGSGNWRLWSEAKFPSYRYDYGAAVTADFDGDGRQDIGLGMHLLGFVVLVQREPGVFELWNRGLDYGPAGTFSSRTIVAADWNRDGRPDLVALGEGPRMVSGAADAGSALPQSFGLVLYLNRGDGSWERRDAGTGAGQVFGDDLQVADVNGDGRLDAFTGSNAQSRQDLLNLGDEDGGWTGTVIPARGNAYVRSVALGDLNQDGRLDLALGYVNYEGELWWTGIDALIAAQDGGFERHVLLGEQSRKSVWGLAIGDINADGVADVAAATGDGEVLVFRGEGAGRFSRQQVSLTERHEDCAGYGVELWDLDGDQAAELFVGFAGESGGGTLATAAGLGSARGCPNEGSLRVWKAVR